MKQSLRIAITAAATVGLLAGRVGFGSASGSTAAGGDDRLQLE